MNRTLVLVALFALAVASGCGEDEATTTTTTDATTTTQEAVSSDPLTCLEEAGLSDVEERASDLWRGYHGSPFYQVTVHLLPSAAEARQVVNDAIDVYAAQGGEYAVTGPATVAAGGLLEGDGGLEANRIVEGVASCLGR